MFKKRSGFTLIELLVVIAIIAILAAILFPVFAKAKENARMTKCANNMKQIDAALLVYLDDFNGRLPDGSGLYTGRYFWLTEASSPLRPQYDGPYIQDIFKNYVKSANVWMCPSVKPEMMIPNPPGASGIKIYFKDNRGTTRAGSKICTNYMWMQTRSHYNPSSNTFSAIKAGGCSISMIKSSSKAIMFLEFPYWTPSPHKMFDRSGADGVKGSVFVGCNVAFLDGHVKLVKDANWAYTYAGWEN